jgi:hypothetical protein
LIARRGVRRLEESRGDDQGSEGKSASACAQEIALTGLCDNQGFPNELFGATQQSAINAQLGRSGLLIALRQIRLLDLSVLRSALS